MSKLSDLLKAASAEGTAAFEAGSRNAGQMGLAKLKDYLQGQSQQREAGLAQEMFDKNKGAGGGTVKVGDTSIGAKEWNPMIQLREESGEGKALESARSKELGKLEDGLKAVRIGDQFLQNPNGKNLSDVKAMAVLAQGLPARAFATEAQASGFNPSTWSQFWTKAGQWDGKTEHNPLTQDDMNAFRGNWGVMRKALVDHFDASKQDFWENTAPTIAPSLDASGRLDQMRAGHEQKIQQMFGGDYHHAPWETPNNPGQPAAPTQPTAQPPGLMGFFKNMVGKAQGAADGMGATVAPQQTGANSQMFGVKPEDIDAEIKRRSGQ